MGSFSLMLFLLFQFFQFFVVHPFIFEVFFETDVVYLEPPEFSHSLSASLSVLIASLLLLGVNDFFLYLENTVGTEGKDVIFDSRCFIVSEIELFAYIAENLLSYFRANIVMGDKD